MGGVLQSALAREAAATGLWTLPGRRVSIPAERWNSPSRRASTSAELRRLAVRWVSISAELRRLLGRRVRASDELRGLLGRRVSTPAELRTLPVRRVSLADGMTCVPARSAWSVLAPLRACGGGRRSLSFSVPLCSVLNVSTLARTDWRLLLVLPHPNDTYSIPFRFE
jgi:hypothetical protein